MYSSGNLQANRRALSFRVLYTNESDYRDVNETP